MEEHCFQVFCWLGLLLCDFINYTHPLINTHLTMLLLVLSRHGEWAPHAAEFSQLVFPIWAKCPCRKQRLWERAGHGLSVWRIWEKANFSKMCWCFSAKQPLHAHICCVSHLAVFSYLQKEAKKACVSAVASAQEMCYPRSLDPTPFPPFPIVLFQAPIPYSFYPNIPSPVFLTEHVIGHGLL